MKEKMLNKEQLASHLIDVFGGYIGTPSEELLHDHGTVIDLLADFAFDGRGIDHTLLTSLPEKVFEGAWNIFDSQLGRTVCGCRLCGGDE